MKKLYEISMDTVFYAIGETSVDAQNAFKEEVTLSDFFEAVEMSDVNEVESVIDALWEKSYPYGTSNKGSMTCGDWVKEIKHKKEMEAKKKEFESKQRKLWEKP